MHSGRLPDELVVDVELLEALDVEVVVEDSDVEVLASTDPPAPPDPPDPESPGANIAHATTQPG